jgi:hypothetical protein
MARPIPLPPLSTLREAFLYDPETGDLTWLADPKNQRRPGDPAGCPNGGGYLQVELGGRRFKAHRICYALHYDTDPGPLLVDHINRVRSDNRACNLRLVDSKGNRANSQALSPVQVTYPDGSTRLLPSTEAAARLLGCSRSSVYRYARGLRPAPNGLIVSYA